MSVPDRVATCAVPVMVRYGRVRGRLRRTDAERPYRSGRARRGLVDGDAASDTACPTTIASGRDEDARAGEVGDGVGADDLPRGATLRPRRYGRAAGEDVHPGVMRPPDG